MKIDNITYEEMHSGNMYMSKDMTRLYRVSNKFNDEKEIEWYALSDEIGYPMFSAYKFMGIVKDIDQNIKQVVFNLGKRPPYKKFENKLVFESIEKAKQKFINYIHNI